MSTLEELLNEQTKAIMILVDKVKDLEAVVLKQHEAIDKIIKASNITTSNVENIGRVVKNAMVVGYN